MFFVNELIGFGASSERILGGIITGGTNIGDMTAGGNLAAAFDGNTNQNGGASAQKATSTDVYVGKTISRRVFKGIFYGSNNFGYVNGINPTVTLALMGKTGSAPANSADGTEFGTLSFTDTANESGNPRTVTATDNETLWEHIWVRITHDGAANNMYCAEAQFYQAV